MPYWHGGAPGLEPGDLLIAGGSPGAHGTAKALDLDYDRARVYVTTDKQLARSFATTSQRGGSEVLGSLYIITPDGPLGNDPDYPCDPPVSFSCAGATVVKVVEARVSMSESEQAKVRAPYSCWQGGGPMYDETGYLTLHPEAARTGVSAEMLRALGPWRLYAEANAELQQALWGSRG